MTRKITHEEQVWIARAALVGMTFRCAVESDGRHLWYWRHGDGRHLWYWRHGDGPETRDRNGWFTMPRAAVAGLCAIGAIRRSEADAALDELAHSSFYQPETTDG